MASRIASRRGVAASIAEQRANPLRARGRIPLARVPSNQRLRPVVEKSVKMPPSQGSIFITPVQTGPFQHVEILIGDPEDPQDVVEFEHIIYRSMRSKENATQRLQFEQSDISMRDRGLLVDALDRFHYKLGLTTNTLYRFIGILDRYLSVAPVPKQKLRVIGCASLLIASKIEDIFPAQSGDLIQLAERGFTQSELFATEIQVINAIRFDTTFATPLFFLTHFMRIHDQTKESLLLGRYILEICQTHERFFGIAPSMVAAVATMVTRILNGQEKWPRELAGYTMYSSDDLDPLAAILRTILLEADQDESRFIRRKYSSEPFHNVAQIKLAAKWP
jgi:hypothetical protein